MSESSKQSMLVEHSVQSLPFCHNGTLQLISSILRYQIEALDFLVEHISYQTVDLVKEILSCQGRVIFTGVGKSGHIARKLAATFASTGTAALFLHPTEAMHGDLGMICPDDMVIGLSKSGVSEEFSLLFPIVRRSGNKVILFTSHTTDLTNHVDMSILIPCDKEAPPLSVVPTTSSLLMLAFGDALALALSSLRDFTSLDFAQNHPGGTLGKTLLLTVQAIMLSEELPLVSIDASFQEVLVVITRRKVGIAIVVDAQGRLMGIITDGDLRRACSKGVSVFDARAAQIMTREPKTVSSEQKAVAALKCMRHFSVTSLIVVDDDQHVVGVLHIHDILRAGIK